MHLLTNSYRLLVALALAAAAGCASPPPPAPTSEKAAAPTPAPTSAAAPAAAAPPPPPTLAHDDAVAAAANALFSKADLTGAAGQGGRYAVVIDPLIDGVSRMQTNATRAMEAKVAQLAKSNYPQFDVRPFTGASLAASPLVIVGTFTPINQQGKTEGTREMYRFCLAMVDLKSGKVVSKTVARSRMENVDHTPQPYFRDAPVWSKDPPAEAYVRTCQASKLGEAINPAYLQTLVAAAVVDEGVRSYNAGRYKEALALFAKAQETTAGKQWRVHNGLYLANWKLGRKEAMAQSFAQLVDYGFDQGNLAVMFLFRPGATVLPPDGKASANDLWLKTIAQRAAQRNACLEIAGHNSRGGPEIVGERLSALRAEFVRQRLVSEVPALGKRVIAAGYGSRETLVGTARDDASDALDRRVEFKLLPCASS